VNLKMISKKGKDKLREWSQQGAKERARQGAANRARAEREEEVDALRRHLTRRNPAR
jgi:hypothetical protein